MKLGDANAQPGNVPVPLVTTLDPAWAPARTGDAANQPRRTPIVAKNIWLATNFLAIFIFPLFCKFLTKVEAHGPQMRERADTVAPETWDGCSFLTRNGKGPTASPARGKKVRGVLHNSHSREKKMHGVTKEGTEEWH
jgi:hypothetical protein